MRYDGELQKKRCQDETITFSTVIAATVYKHTHGHTRVYVQIIVWHNLEKGAGRG